MTLRACVVCGRASSRLYRGRCARDRQTTSQRGYGRDHQAFRAELARTLPAPCAYGCGRTLTASDRWVAAHVVDGDPRSRRVVSCVPCNERAKIRPGVRA
jgi:hypothetical protein